MLSLRLASDKVSMTVTSLFQQLPVSSTDAGAGTIDSSNRNTVLETYGAHVLLHHSRRQQLLLRDPLLPAAITQTLSSFCGLLL